MGELITVRVNPARVVKGFNQGTVSIVLTTGTQAELPVALLIE